MLCDNLVLILRNGNLHNYGDLAFCINGGTFSHETLTLGQVLQLKLPWYFGIV